MDSVSLLFNNSLAQNAVELMTDSADLTLNSDLFKNVYQVTISNSFSIINLQVADKY